LSTTACQQGSQLLSPTLKNTEFKLGWYILAPACGIPYDVKKSKNETRQWIIHIVMNKNKQWTVPGFHLFSYILTFKHCQCHINKNPHTTLLTNLLLDICGWLNNDSRENVNKDVKDSFTHQLQFFTHCGQAGEWVLLIHIYKFK
jgi:hypothetical protein